MLSFDDALAQLLAAASPVSEMRNLPLEAASGRVLARSQCARVNLPPLDNAAMDGYAVRLADIANAHALPVSQRIPAGHPGGALQPGSVARIFTGAPIPEGADAVVMQEQCELAPGGGVRLLHSPQAGEHIRRAGEDIQSGAEILAAGTRLRPQDVALAAAGGLAELPVWRRLRVALMLTGDELVAPGQPLPPGAIYDSNRYALRSLLEGLGCEVRDLGRVPDDLAATRSTLRAAAQENDLIVSSGGVSVGEEDHVKAAVEAEGHLVLWKINIKPGKPLAFGEVHLGDGGRRWFIGLPGNPVSSFVTFLMLARPFIRRLQGCNNVVPPAYWLPAAFERPRAESRTEFLRVKLNAQGALTVSGQQGSGMLTSLSRADGLAQLPPDTPIRAGDPVRFIPFSELL